VFHKEETYDQDDDQEKYVHVGYEPRIYNKNGPPFTAELDFTKEIHKYGFAHWFEKKENRAKFPTYFPEEFGLEPVDTVSLIKEYLGDKKTC